MRQSGEVVRPFSYAARFLIRGTSSGAPTWHQPTQSSPSKTSAAWALPSRTRCSFAARFCATSVQDSLGWKPMHQQPPKIPVVALHQRSERGPGRLIQRLDGVPRFDHEVEPNAGHGTSLSSRTSAGSGGVTGSGPVRPDNSAVARRPFGADGVPDRTGGTRRADAVMTRELAASPS